MTGKGKKVNKYRNRNVTGRGTCLFRMEENTGPRDEDETKKKEKKQGKSKDSEGPGRMSYEKEGIQEAKKRKGRPNIPGGGEEGGTKVYIKHRYLTIQSKWGKELE